MCVRWSRPPVRRASSVACPRTRFRCARPPGSRCSPPWPSWSPPAPAGPAPRPANRRRLIGGNVDRLAECHAVQGRAAGQPVRLGAGGGDHGRRHLRHGRARRCQTPRAAPAAPRGAFALRCRTRHDPGRGRAPRPARQEAGLQERHRPARGCHRAAAAHGRWRPRDAGRRAGLQAPVHPPALRSDPGNPGGIRGAVAQGGRSRALARRRAGTRDPVRAGRLRPPRRTRPGPDPAAGASIADWPLAVPLATFGAPVAKGSQRCGIVSGADAEALRPALEGANQQTQWVQDPATSATFGSRCGRSSPARIPAPRRSAAEQPAQGAPSHDHARRPARRLRRGGRATSKTRPLEHAGGARVDGRRRDPRAAGADRVALDDRRPCSRAYATAASSSALATPVRRAPFATTKQLTTQTASPGSWGIVRERPSRGSPRAVPARPSPRPRRPAARRARAPDPPRRAPRGRRGSPPASCSSSWRPACARTGTSTTSDRRQPRTARRGRARRHGRRGRSPSRQFCARRSRSRQLSAREPYPNTCQATLTATVALAVR